ncbi:MAG: hypothetical protein M1825_002766 [Sarcosagium campestre]|nr:MAG: hypothetical protein M1825_002766 [Sarcosagium campestre]
MAPIRRYLRISKYSVLECRIYLDNPALADSWLLNPRNPILPRVIESVRPLVLPKLREEIERSRGKTSRKANKGVKDTVIQDDFEVSVFLTNAPTRHTLLTKQKLFKTKGTKLASTSARLTGTSSHEPIELDKIVSAADDATSSDEVIIREESDDDEDDLTLRDVPPASAEGVDLQRHDPSNGRGDDDLDDDKKKLGFNTTYEGFNIYGKMLCLIVKRTQLHAAGAATWGGESIRGGQAMMEDWISSTQVGPSVDVGS